MANVDAFNSGFNAGAGRKDDKKKMDSYKKGGKVRKTGPALLHKGERVLTVKQSQKKSRKKVSPKRA